jgi:tetratricopeptide (TPR) repeat protein
MPVLIKHYGASDPRVGRMLGKSAAAHAGLGDYERALGANHADVGLGLVALAHMTAALGDTPRALEHAERAATILASLAPAHSGRMNAATTRAQLLLRARRDAEARTALAAVVEQGVSADAAKLAKAAGILVLAEVERLQGNYARARELAEGVLADAACNRDVKLVADAHWQRAYALARQGDRGGADAARERALAALPPAAPSDAQVYADAKFALMIDAASAAERLSQAVARGFRNALLLSDPDFDALRQAPGFAAITRALARSRADGPVSVSDTNSG